MNRQALRAAKADRRGVHNLQVTLNHIQIRERFEHRRCFVFGGISGIDAVDFGCLQYCVGFDLERPKRGGRISCKERIPGPGCEYDNAAFFEMANRAAAYERLSYFAHFDRAHHSSESAVLFERILQRNRIEHGGQHPHVIGRGSIESLCRKRQPAKDVSRANNYGYFDSSSRTSFTSPAMRAITTGSIP